MVITCEKPQVLVDEIHLILYTWWKQRDHTSLNKPTAKIFLLPPDIKGLRWMRRIYLLQCITVEIGVWNIKKKRQFNDDVVNL